MVLAHGGHFAVYLFPVAAVVCLVYVLRGDKAKHRNSYVSTPTLPKSTWSRQVRAATRPPRPERAAASTKPRFAPADPSKAPDTKTTVTPLQQPWLRQRRGA